MIKKSPKKLSLARETLRLLEAELVEVKGAGAQPATSPIEYCLASHALTCGKGTQCVSKGPLC